MSIREKLAGLIIILTALACLSCGNGGENNADADKAPENSAKETKSRSGKVLAEAEKSLVSIGEPYLVLDIKRKLMIIKMQGTTLKEMPFSWEQDSTGESISETQFVNDTVREGSIEKVHLFTAVEKFGDTLVSIVSSATNARREQIQHFIPQHMTFICDNDIVISIESDVDGRTVSFWENQIEGAKVFIKQVFTGTDLFRVHMEGEDAMSLWGASQAGMKIFIVS